MNRTLGRLSKQGVLILASLTAVFPVYVMLSAAFKSQSGFLAHPFTPSLHPSLHGFDAALNDQFPRWFANSAILTTGSVAATLALAGPAGWGLFPGELRGGGHAH